MSFLKRDDSDENKQFYAHVRIVAREAFLVLMGLVLLTFIFLRFTEVRGVMRSIAKSLQSITFGLVIAYLLDPMVKVYRKMFDKLFRSERDKLAKSLSIMLGIISGLLILAGMVGLLIPTLGESISRLVADIPNYITTIQDVITKWVRGNSWLASYLSTFTESAMTSLQSFIQNRLTELSSELMATVGNGLVDFVKTIINLFIGFVIAVYLLRDKELALSQSRKVIYAVLSKKRADVVMDICRQGHQLFSGFIIGKLIDSLIIGLITAVFCVISSMPYGVLVSVIIGVTNIIPFFGPFIGAVPCGLLILLTNPVKCLIFVIFIFILQQIDGNIIGPRILGDRTNLNEFWVTFSILLFGGLFGFFGMVVGVPLFGVIYYIIRRVLDLVLERKKLPTQSSAYKDVRSSKDLKETKKQEKIKTEIAESDSETTKIAESK